MLTDTISRLIADVWAGAAGGAGWDRPLADLLQTLNPRFALVSVVDNERCSYIDKRWHFLDGSSSQDAVGEYQEEMWREDRSLSWALAHPQARFCDSQRAFGPSLDSPYLRWSRSRFGSGHFLVGYGEAAPGLTLGVSIHAAASDAVLSDRTKQLFRLVYPHIEGAARVVAQPPTLEGAAALVAIDVLGRVRGASEAAWSVLAARDGIALDNGVLVAATRRASVELDRALRSAIDALVGGGCGGALRLPRPSGRRPLIVRVEPLPRPSGDLARLGAAALVRILDFTAPRAISTHQCALFGLTLREAEVASALMSGHSPESLAAALGISIATARIHLRALFRKTATSRQSELIRLLIESG